MKLLILGLMALGLALVGFGLWCMSQGASADERAGGAWPIVFGVVILAIDFLGAFVWLVLRG